MSDVCVHDFNFQQQQSLCVAVPSSSSVSSPSLSSLPSAYAMLFEQSYEPEAADAYSLDEFRMFEFKVRRCTRGRSHDWTDCPFAHPGEKARRRDPRLFRYSGTPCPDYRKGSCKRGEACEFAHGVFECWLHPTRYRTQLCNDGTACLRKVCFFAHTVEQLRLLPTMANASLSAACNVEGGIGTAAHPAASKLRQYQSSPRNNTLGSSPVSTLLPNSVHIPSPKSILHSPSIFSSTLTPPHSPSVFSATLSPPHSPPLSPGKLSSPTTTCDNPFMISHLFPPSHSVCDLSPSSQAECTASFCLRSQKLSSPPNLSIGEDLSTSWPALPSSNTTGTHTQNATSRSLSHLDDLISSPSSWSSLPSRNVTGTQSATSKSLSNLDEFFSLLQLSRPTQGQCLYGSQVKVGNSAVTRTRSDKCEGAGYVCNSHSLFATSSKVSWHGEKAWGRKEVKVEPVLERVESGRSLRAKIFESLRKSGEQLLGIEGED